MGSVGCSWGHGSGVSWYFLFILLGHSCIVPVGCKVTGPWADKCFLSWSPADTLVSLQALPSLQIPVSPHIYTSISWAAAPAAASPLSPVSVPLCTRGPGTSPGLGTWMVVTRPPAPRLCKDPCGSLSLTSPALSEQGGRCSWRSPGQMGFSCGKFPDWPRVCPSVLVRTWCPEEREEESVGLLGRMQWQDRREEHQEAARPCGKGTLGCWTLK